MIKRWTRWYGAQPLELVLGAAGLAVAVYAALHLAGDPDWRRVLLWFVAAVIGHDLVLFPLYAAADGLLVRVARRRGVVNFVRVPVLASGLTFLLFLPGIIQQGAVSYHAATGQTQAPFLTRWLLLVAGFFAASALAYVLRPLLTRKPVEPAERPADAPDRPR